METERAGRSWSWRVAAAFAVAPLTVPLLFAVLKALELGVLEGVALLPRHVLLYGPFAYASALTLGVIAFLLRPRAERVLPLYCTVCGGAIGIVIAGVLFWWGGVRWNPVELFGLSALAGALSGICFWAVGFGRTRRGSSAE